MKLEATVAAAAGGVRRETCLNDICFMKVTDLNKSKIPVIAFDKKLERFHDKVLFPKKLAKANAKLLPWVHKTISNAKRLLLDVEHRIDDDFLENYLNEFCVKLNTRYYDNLFDRVMIAAVTYKWNYLGERYRYAYLLLPQ
jgi:hypothetical protein